MTASATHIAALNVRAKALEVAAELLQTTPDALDIADGEVFRRVYELARAPGSFRHRVGLRLLR